jgi:hypothetical protein
MERKTTILLVTTCLALSAVAEPAVNDVTVRQRWPWSRLVDIDYVLTGDPNERADVAVTAKDGPATLELPAASLSGDRYGVAPGRRRIVWDPAMTVYTNNQMLTQFNVTLTLNRVPLYMIVDLTLAPGAEDQIQYVYEADLHAGAWGPAATNPVAGVESVIWTGVTNAVYKTDKLVLRRIQAGAFGMGGNASLSVTMTKDFYAGVFEVTQRQWFLIRGTDPAEFKNPAGPVAFMTYEHLRGTAAQGGGGWPTNDAVYGASFVGQIRAHTDVALELPTEAKWEYFCRAGTSADYNGGVTGTATSQLNQLGWWDNNAQNMTHEVGLKLPNAWGLYDTHGNVWEWCLDWHADTLDGGIDPKGPVSGTTRVLRGGSWQSGDQNCRAHTRHIAREPAYRSQSLGFRLVYNLQTGPTTAAAQNQLVIDSVPEGMRRAPFEVHVREVGGDYWKPLFVYHAESLSTMPRANGGAEGFVMLAFTGGIELRATFPLAVYSVQARPSLREPVATAVNGRSVNWTLPRPRYLTLEVNWQPPDGTPLPRYTLHVLADQPEKDPPLVADPAVKVLTAGHHTIADFDPGTRQTLCLAPGIHTVEGGVVPLHSDKRLHLSGGAVLRAKVIGDAVRDARLTGRGILDGSTTPRDPGDWRSEGEQAFVFLRRGEDITIDGPVIYNSPYWNIVAFGTQRLTIRNHKAVTWKVNNDGVQPRSCTDLLVENCFLKCADDCIAIKTRRAAAMESRRLLFRDLVLWNDTPGNPMEIGHTSQAELLEDIRFRDIEVIHSEGDAHAINMCIVDQCTVRNVNYENIYVEGVKAKDIRMQVTTTRYSTDEQRGRIQQVTITNYCSDEGPRGGQLTGYDAQHAVEDVLIQNFVTFYADPAQRRTLATLAELGLSFKHTANIRYTVLP